MTTFLDYIGDEIWLLDTAESAVKGILSSLPEASISMSSNGMLAQLSNGFNHAVFQGGRLYLTECGAAFRMNDGSTTLALHASSKDATNIQLQFLATTSGDFISIEIPADTLSNLAIKQLSTHVLNTLNDLSAISPQCSRSVCPCCVEKRKEIQNNPSVHPLYSLFNNLILDQEPLSFTLDGKHLSSTLSFIPRKMATSQGVVTLSDDSQQCAVDLTQIYNARVSIESMHGEEFTQLTAYNSHGIKVFTLRQAGARGYHLWRTALPTTKAPL